MEFRGLFLQVVLLSSICLFFTSFVSAWGPLTHRFICERSVEEVWGGDVLEECFTESPERKVELCKLVRDVKGEWYYTVCMRGEEFIHPSLIPYAVFNDTLLHYDYSICPIPEYEVADRKWLCNESAGNLATKQTGLWFRVSNETDDVCRRVYAFCIASNYFSDSHMPLYQMMHVLPESMDEMETKVDKAVSDGEVPWNSQTLVVFQYKNKRSARRFYVSNNDVDGIIDELVVFGEGLGFAKSESEETCFDGIRNQDEVEVDCGGVCLPCIDDMSCLMDSECVSGWCHMGECRSSTCFDGLAGPDEVGVDCGGPCEPCPESSSGGVVGSMSYLFLVFFAGFFVFVLILAALIFFVVRRSPGKSVNIEDVAGGLDDLGLENIGDELDEVRSTLDNL